MTSGGGPGGRDRGRVGARGPCPAPAFARQMGSRVEALRADAGPGTVFRSGQGTPTSEFTEVAAAARTRTARAIPAASTSLGQSVKFTTPDANPDLGSKPAQTSPHEYLPGS